MRARDLLYDAGCSLCAALAREVEALSEGRLRVRSLREPEVQTLLNRVRPGWRWEPMLLEEDGERVRVYAGLAMRMRLIRILGPARAWRVAQLVARFGGPVLGVDWGRRTFLRRAIGALAGWIILREEGTPSSAATALSLFKSSLSIPEEIEILTGILRERWENGIIIETHDQTWRITLDPLTSIWKGGERDAEVLQIGDEVMVRGWRSRGDFSFRALRIWVNLTRIRGVLLEATSSGWRIQGGQHHGEEEKYEVVWHASPTLLDLATCTPLSGNGIRIREGMLMDIIGEALGDHRVNATRIEIGDPTKLEKPASRASDPIKVVKMLGTCTYVYQGHARWFNCPTGAGRCRTCNTANSAQAAWPAMDRCGSCSWSCCDCSRGCRNQVYLSCNSQVMVKDLCTGASRQITIVDCGPNQNQYCTAGCGWPDCLRYSTPIIDLTRPTFAWFHDPAQGCFSCEVWVTIPC